MHRDDADLLPAYESPDIKLLKGGAEEFGETIYFQDGVSKIDMILPYVDKLHARGEAYLRSLEEYGVMVEKCRADEEVSYVFKSIFFDVLPGEGKINLNQNQKNSEG